MVLWWVLRKYETRLKLVNHIFDGNFNEDGDLRWIIRVVQLKRDVAQLLCVYDSLEVKD